MRHVHRNPQNIESNSELACASALEMEGGRFYEYMHVSIEGYAHPSIQS